MEMDDCTKVTADYLGKILNKRILYNSLLKDYKLPNINTCKANTKEYLMGLAIEPSKYH